MADKADPADPENLEPQGQCLNQAACLRWRAMLSIRTPPMLASLSPERCPRRTCYAMVVWSLTDDTEAQRSIGESSASSSCDALMITCRRRNCDPGVRPARQVAVVRRRSDDATRIRTILGRR